MFVQTQNRASLSHLFDTPKKKVRFLAQNELKVENIDTKTHELKEEATMNVLRVMCYALSIECWVKYWVMNVKRKSFVGIVGKCGELCNLAPLNKITVRRC